MILRFASMIRRWSSAELSIAGRQIYVIDYDEGLFVDGTPLDRVLRSFLRTRSGYPLGLEDWSPAEKKAALEAVVTGQSRLGGIDVMDILQLRRFVVEIRMAESEEALDDLALRFMRRWHETNHLSYAHLRASASATVL
jgi:hypothetical protein